MAIRTSDNGTYLTRTSGLLDPNSLYTRCFWIYISVDSNGFTHFHRIGAIDSVGSGDWHSSDHIGTNGDGTTLRLGSVILSTGTWATGTNLAVNTWHHIAVVRRSATLLEAYLNGVLDITNARDITGRIAAVREVVGVANVLEHNGRTAAYKAWSAALSADEIKNEMRTYVPLRMANIHSWSPLLAGSSERLRDYGGGLNWTENGAITDEDNPPITWGGRSLFPQFVAGGGGAISGSTAGVATVAGTLVGRGALSGSTAGAATTAGVLRGRAVISASVAGTSTVTGTLRARGVLTGTIAGLSTTAATIRATGSLSGSAAGVASVTGTLTPPVGALSGTIAGTCTVTGTLQARGALSGTVAGTSTVTGTLTARGSLSGLITGTCTVTGTLTPPFTPGGEDTIDGQPSVSINNAYGAVTLYHRGDRRFFIIGTV